MLPVSAAEHRASESASPQQPQFASSAAVARSSWRSLRGRPPSRPLAPPRSCEVAAPGRSIAAPLRGGLARSRTLPGAPPVESFGADQQIPLTFPVLEAGPRYPFYCRVRRDRSAPRHDSRRRHFDCSGARRRTVVGRHRGSPRTPASAARSAGRGSSVIPGARVLAAAWMRCGRLCGSVRPQRFHAGELRGIVPARRLPRRRKPRVCRASADRGAEIRTRDL